MENFVSGRGCVLTAALSACRNRSIAAAAAWRSPEVAAPSNNAVILRSFSRSCCSVVTNSTILEYGTARRARLFYWVNHRAPRDTNWGVSNTPGKNTDANRGSIQQHAEEVPRSRNGMHYQGREDCSWRLRMSRLTSRRRPSRSTGAGRAQIVFGILRQG